MDSKQLMTGAIATTRGAIGLAAFVAPRYFQDRAGLSASKNPQSPYLVRIAGGRDLGLAIGVLSSRPEARRRWATVSLGCDLGDALAGVAGMRSGYLDGRTGAFLTGTAALAVVLGAFSLS
ncbi:MAG: hypothetical protein ACYCU0_02940 [Solirubrobacteraceae bacterium]